MPVNGKSTEKELATAALKILAPIPSGAALYRDIIADITKHHSLTSVDQMASITRLGEEMWEQRVRNITCHKASPGNFIHKGLLTSIPDGLKITEKGREYLKRLPH